jgi:hypothetical protein
MQDGYNASMAFASSAHHGNGEVPGRETEASFSEMDLFAGRRNL